MPLPDTFSRLLPLATASHVRLVVLSRRGYSGSTAYSMEEISDLDPAVTYDRGDSCVEMTPANDQLSGHFSTFMKQRAAEMAQFLAWFIDNEQIPPRSTDTGGVHGGISLLGWSLGNTTSLSLLAYADTLDPVLVKKLEGYLRKIVVFGTYLFYFPVNTTLSVALLIDPPNHALGYRKPKNSYNPLFDPTIPPAERQPTFKSWITSYFNHSPLALDTVSSCNLMNGLEQKTPDPSKQTTLARLSPAALQAGFEIVTPAHGDPFSLFEYAQPVHEDVRLRAIFGNPNGTSGPAALPNVEVSYIWCTQSTWETVLAARRLKAEIASPVGYFARPVTFFELDGNHFVRRQCDHSIWNSGFEKKGALGPSIEDVRNVRRCY